MLAEAVAESNLHAHKFHFSSERRLKRRSQFTQITHSGRHFSGSVLAITWVPSKGVESRLGITVTKKFGKANQRNLFKRLVREAFRRLSPDSVIKVDIIIRPKRIATPAQKGAISYKAVEQDLLAFFRMFSRNCGGC